MVLRLSGFWTINIAERGMLLWEYDAFNRNTKTETFDGHVQIKRYDAEGLRHEMEENGKLVHEVDPNEHRNNSALHQNKYNQGADQLFQAKYMIKRKECRSL